MTYFLMSEYLLALVFNLASGQAVLCHELGLKAQPFRNNPGIATMRTPPLWARDRWQLPLEVSVVTVRESAILPQ